MKWLAVSLGLLLVAETVAVKVWWEDVTIVGICTVLAAVTLAITQIITLWRSGRTQKVVEETAVVNAAQVKQLTKIEAIGHKTIDLVDGGKSELLAELATIRREAADKSGLASDEVAADLAQRKYEDQSARVDEAEANASAAHDRRDTDKPDDK